MKNKSPEITWYYSKDRKNEIKEQAKLKAYLVSLKVVAKASNELPTPKMDLLTFIKVKIMPRLMRKRRLKNLQLNLHN